MDREQAANELARRGVTLEDMKNYFLTVAEPVAAMGSGIVAEPLAGFAGLAAAPFGSDAAANAVNYYRDKLTYSPRSEAGQSGMTAVGEAMAPIGEAMDYAASGAGDYIYDKTGSPALAAAAYSAPTAALELLGLKGVNQLSKSGKLGQPLEFGDIGSGGVGNKQRGIFAGVKAKGADLKRQAAAEELANRGIGRDQIWQETGWFNDVDGSWKFEIDDSQSRLKLENFDKHSFGGIADYDAHRLGGVLDSEALTQYPELAKYEQSILASDVADPDNIGGSFEPDSKRIRVVATDFDKAKSATLHELTHAIQQEEGFAKGGSADRLMGQYKKDLKNKDYYAQAATDERLAARKTPEYMDIQKKIDVALANGDKEALKPLVEARRVIENEVADIFDQEVARLADKTRFDPFEQYQRLAGEAEARNVQTRMDYTPEQRQAAAPWTTLDVPESELIVRGNSNGPMMSVSKAQAIEELGHRVDTAKAELNDFVAKNKSIIKIGSPEQKAAVMQQADELNSKLKSARRDKLLADENLGITENIGAEGKVAAIDLDVTNDGAGNVKYTDRSTGGYIDVLVDDTAARSGNVTGLYVPDEFRGQGVANSLLRAAMDDNPDMMGQVSSKKAAVNAYRAGRRPIDNPNATIGDVLRAIDENSSVNMATSERRGVSVENLYKTHNITIGGLEKAKEFGGIPVPSLAVAGKDAGFDAFGEISLIGDKGSFTKDPTFASDVYSPRFPQSIDKIDRVAANTEIDRLSGIVPKEIDSSFSSQFSPERLGDDLTRVESSIGNQAAFLRGLGENIDPTKYTSAPKAPDLKMDGYGFALRGERLSPRDALTNKGHIDATSNWLRQFDENGVDVDDWRNPDGTPNEEVLKLTYRSMRQERQALDEFDKGPKFDKAKAKQDIEAKVLKNKEKFDSYIRAQKNRLSSGKVFTKWNPKTATTKEFDFNLNNAVKLMKGNIRGGEGFSYGVGNIRAQVAPKLTSIKQIQDRRGQIVGEDQMTMVKEGFDSRLDNLYDSLSTKWNWDGEPSHSDFAEGIANAAKGDMSDFKGLNLTDKKELQGFFDELANAPTNYFEIKPQRAVNIKEFYGAAVPEGTSQSVIDDLKSQGLEVELYKPEQRKEAIKRLNAKSGGNIFFSGAGAAMLYGELSGEDEQNQF